MANPTYLLRLTPPYFNITFAYNLGVTYECHKLIHKKTPEICDQVVCRLIPNPPPPPPPKKKKDDT